MKNLIRLFLLTGIMETGICMAQEKMTMEKCCLVLSGEGVISQRTVMQKKMTLWHDNVAGMLKSEEKMKSSSVPETAKNWMRLMMTDGLDFAHPEPLICIWENIWNNHAETRKECFVEIAEDRMFRKGVMRFYPPKHKNYAEIHSMKSGTKYFLRLLWKDDGGKKYSQTLSFTTAEEVPRWIHVEGLSNVRDFGGWKSVYGGKIRQGLFFRGPELNSSRKPTSEGKRMLLKNLQIRTDLDIRGSATEKWPENGSPALPEKQVRHILFPLGCYEGVFYANQRKMYAEILRLLLEEKNFPCYVHCVGGADRTGTLIFLLHGLLGVPEEDMLRDYEITSMFSAYRGNRYRGRAAFEAFLKELKKTTGEKGYHKQCEKYFLDCGITPAEIRTFRNIFLEKDK